MHIQDRRSLRCAAAEALSQASFHPGKLALIHTGAAAALSLLLTVINLFLADQIGETGGLSGIGLRSVLTTAQSTLGILSAVLLPFWEMGFLFAAMKMARKESATPMDLFQGFRRFGPVLRLFLLEILLYFSIMILSANIGSFLFMLTPFAQPLAEIMSSITPENITATMETAMDTLMEAAVPMYVIIGIVLAALAIPVLYRFRMARYLILDEPKLGALQALGTSHKLMRHNRWSLFRLDLSLWWYYLLTVLCAVLAYSDALLPTLGITLPFSETAALLLSFGLYCIAQLLLAWFFLSPVAVTYATAYDTLKEMQKGAEPRLTKNFPWDFLPEQSEK